MATVRCQNCGAEVVIPDHGYNTYGHVVGKDDDGEYIVRTEKEHRHYESDDEEYDGFININDNETTMATSKKNESKKVGIMTGEERDILMALFEKLKNDPECKQMVRDIFKDIDEDGYLKVDGVIRQWIPAQVLENLRRDLGCKSDFERKGNPYYSDTFHGRLTNRCYRYSWKVLVDELWRQCAMLHQKDQEAFDDRNRFYNPSLAVVMANHFIKALDARWDELKVCSHEGRSYKKLKIGGINGGKGIHCDEYVSKVKNVLVGLVNKMEYADTFRGKYDAVNEFYAWVKRIHWTPRKMSKSFVNVYKAAGAYYTLKDLVMHEGLRFKVDGDGSIASFSNCRTWVGDVDREESLELLEEYTNGIGDMMVLGYCIMGLLKDAIQYNHLDVNAKLADWREQSRKRREERKADKNRRSRK